MSIKSFANKKSFCIIATFLALSLTACDSSNDSPDADPTIENSTQEDDSSIPIDQESNPVTDTSLDGLPPDPGEAGKATLEGIDSDEDGVRDDVQRWIAIDLTVDDNVKNALKQNSKNMSAVFASLDNAEMTRTNLKKLLDDSECLHYVNGYDRDGFYKSRELDNAIEAIFYNTKERVQSWAKAQEYGTASIGSENLSMDETIEKARNSCNFDVI